MRDLLVRPFLQSVCERRSSLFLFSVRKKKCILQQALV